ncbi:MAG: hypothetical protein OM95_14050 [Bdellovibrio sp. ArHS]|uniref:hypothetical protein n=1 Tax=Bdellovibrio sp. ArHS TaxID=1569284 RepID=UPI0005828EB8|nr:hypothetical protein [Bdellovibrio sp. ArHS]KHD87490.1 MAG: hypothetical protein OM95_14050 [Bdellovibrio sp. ArHS]
MRISLLFLAIAGLTMSFQNCGQSSMDSTSFESADSASEAYRSMASSAAPTLDNLWKGEAYFRPYRKTVFSSNSEFADGDPSKVFVKDGVWYAVVRSQYHTSNSTCGTRIASVLYASYDKGITWSQRQVVADPGNQSSMCAHVDGSIYYEAAEKTWYYLGQCLSLKRRWDLCLYTRNAADPMGSWQASSRNPVVKSQDLWSQICRSSGACPTTTSEEGTPQIVSRSNGWFYVTFHGFKDGMGYRGMAKTQDFSTWVTTDADLSRGPLFKASHCQGAVPGCIGAGYASILSEGSYNYQLIETPTVSLACTQGQRWPFLLTRTANLYAQSVTWQTLANKAFIENSLPGPIGCHLQYAHLFKDGAEIYLGVSYYTDTGDWYPYGLYKLEWNGTPLQDIPSLNELTRIRFLGVDISGGGTNTGSGSGGPPSSGGSAGSQTTFQAETELNHQIGYLDGLGWAVNTASNPRKGYLSYGPYKSFPATVSSVDFYLMVDNNSADNAVVASLDVHDATAGQILGKKDITRKEFLAPRQYQKFSVPVSLQGRENHLLEARTYSHGVSYLNIDGVIFSSPASVIPTPSPSPTPVEPPPPAPSEKIVFEGEGTGVFQHQLGYADGNGWSANTASSPRSGYLAYGPYATLAGKSRADFYLLVDNNSADNLVVVVIDIRDATTGEVLARKEIRRKEFPGPYIYGAFSLSFSTAGRDTHLFETRVYTQGVSYVKFDGVVIN